MLSPVTIASSTAETPSVTSPSVATFSPGRTTMRSPGMICPIGSSVSIPSRSTRAVRACSPTSRLMACEVRPLARASSSRPIRISVMITTDES